jgi:thiol-disulfide isomerase/thioredoxin
VPAAAEVTLDDTNSELVDGGIRLVRAGLARTAPEFRLTDRVSVVHTNESLRGRVVWVDLWSDWCGTCRAEFPFVQQLHERFAPSGLTVLAVCRNSTPEGFRQAAEKDWIGFATVDASREEPFPFPYAAFPTSVVLDRAGRVRAYWRGHRSPEAVEGLLRRLLAEPAPAGDIVPAPPAVVPADGGMRLRGSAEVVRATLEFPRRVVSAGGLFEADVVLDVEPGWHLNAQTDPGLVPLTVRLGDGVEGVRTFHQLRPPTRTVLVVGEQLEVHDGRIRVPVWGIVASDWPPGLSLPLEIVATVQACDATVCLAPAEIAVVRNLWVEALGEP